MRIDPITDKDVGPTETGSQAGTPSEPAQSVSSNSAYVAIPPSPARKRKPRRWERAFLIALAQTGNMTAAARASGLSPKHAWAHAQKFPDFDEAIQEAKRQAADRLEEEAVRRAVEGCPRKKFTSRGEPIQEEVTNPDGTPVLVDGQKVYRQYVEREYSDRLLEFLLTGARPEKYRPKSDKEPPTAVVITVPGRPSWSPQ